MKSLLLTAAIASALFSFVFPASAQSQYAGTYSGIFSVTHCKKGYVSADGLFEITIQSDGSISGTSTNDYGATVITGYVTQKGKVIAFSSDSTGFDSAMTGKIDKTGSVCSGKVKSFCKFKFYGQKQ